MRIPELPGADTVSAHHLTHLPAAPWCEMCITSRGRDAPRRETARLAAKIPEVQLDDFSQGAGQGVVAIDRTTGDILESGTQRKRDHGPHSCRSLRGCKGWDTARECCSQMASLQSHGSRRK